MREVKIHALAPVGMPILSRGRHDSPADGACLMEYVSVLAGEPFSDHPRCVDPLLARLAWAVNDWSNESVRSMLVLLAPRMIGTRNDDPVTAPTILLACMDFVSSECGLPQNSFGSRRKRAEKRLRNAEQRPSGRRARWADCRYREFQADDVIRECVQVLADASPNSLPFLLRAGVTSLDAVNGLSAKGNSAPPQGESSPLRYF